jgi:hypothetical protein
MLGVKHFHRDEYMPKGPSGEKRPADVIGAAVMVGKIATGEIAEDLGTTDDGKDKAAVALGRKGGAARAAKLSKKRKAEIARHAAKKRWNK